MVRSSTVRGRALDCARMSFLLRAASLASIVALAACSSSSSGDDGTGDTAFGSDTGGDASVDGGGDTHVGSDATGVDTTGVVDTSGDAGCNNQANLALEVVDQNVAAAFPSGTGGLIADGVYVVTAVTHYTGVGGKTGPGTKKLTETIKIAGNSVAGVIQADTAAGYAFNATIVTSAASLKWKQTCPDGAVGVTYSYSVGDASLDVLDDTTKTVTTYTKKFITPGG